ncbi:aspartate--ammonia ligase [Mesomycoplasma lagogenitalium]|uniref:Aspartate--ammonia ligase n=1 Tax=Mesomycoplasma lagogenitalium TaxID=171286 RepID=A0ABY8LU14_9BACT|nr:aspartate--ammonia ligase [Mesomycoplasma lagogenitalium]WGI36726.1 aspartate--ammonia ligase [Mesomycoplasma lagogenitalium]
MYKSKLSIKETQIAIQNLKKYFQEQLKKNLNLVRATAPLFVAKTSGLNDGLNGEAPVSFKVKGSEQQLEVVHSLAKWKRNALKEYNFDVYEGIYTDMNAIRREEELDNTHSYYVDQWDWEKIIENKDRNLNYLKETVNLIYDALYKTKEKLVEQFPNLTNDLVKKVYFISSQELENKYPNYSVDERETLITKEKGAVFVYQIGYPLKSKIIHSRRAFDYDDWNLNGDLLVYSKVLEKAIELSSMGIRVNEKSILEQSKMSKKEIEQISPYHYNVVNNLLPLTIGGGIGQSRVSMFLLEKKHIGEVQSSYWPENYKLKLKKEGIEIL